MHFKDFQNRVGLIRVSLPFLNTHPQDVMELMGAGIVTRAEYLMSYNAIEYHYCSPLLPEVPEGGALPEYMLEITDGNLTITPKE